MRPLVFFALLLWLAARAQPQTECPAWQLQLSSWPASYCAQSVSGWHDQDHGMIDNCGYQLSCPCTFYSYEMQCACASGQYSDMPASVPVLEASTACWTGETPCVTANSPGYYTAGCGCTGNSCSAGTPNTPCPVGNMCPGKTQNPTPCPAGQFQDQVGKPTCKPCSLDYGTYIVNSTFQSAIPCDPITGVIPNAAGVVKTCTQCTDIQLVAIKNCPAYNPKAVIDVTTGMCDGCQTCAGQTDTANQMQLYSYMPKPCVNSPADQCIYTHLNAAGVPSAGPMPWVQGYYRAAGIVSLGTEYVQDILPQYQKCGTTAAIAGASSVAASLVDNQCIQLAPGGGAATGCINDCEMAAISVCNSGFYSTFSSNGLLLACTPCPPNSKSVAAYPTICMCDAGYIQLGDLALGHQLLPARGLVSQGAIFGLTLTAVSATYDNTPMWCFSCSSDVYVTASSGVEFVQQAMACPSPSPNQDTYPANTLQPCLSGQALVNNVCTYCDAGWAPSANRQMCSQCLPGFQCPYKASGGIPCDGTREFASGPGMASCARKTTRCAGGGGMMLVTNTDPTLNNTCTACPAQCDGGAYLVFQDGHNATLNPCCSDSSVCAAGTAFFACWPQTPQDAGDQTPLIATNPEFRLSYAGAAATVEECPENLLPSNAAWVWNMPKGTYGKECYFACKHAVQPHVAASLNSNISRLIATTRADLAAYYLTPPPVVAPETPVVQVPLLWGGTTNVLAGSAPGASWTVATQQKVSRDALAINLAASNTFLLVDEAMTPYAIADLCLAPELAYQPSTSCPLGYAPVTALTGDEQCALDARQGLFKTPTYWGVSEDACYVTSSSTPVCWSLASTPAAVLGGFNMGCTDCMLAMQTALATYNLQNVINPYSTVQGLTVAEVSAGLAFVAYWLQAKPWAAYERLTLNIAAPSLPYRFGAGCQGLTCLNQKGLEMWKYTVQGFSACIPCDAADSQPICDLEGRYFVSTACDAGVTSQTAPTYTDVCVQCPQQLQGATLMVQGASNDYNNWYSADSWRNSGADSANWLAMSCRYYCAANYTSNPSQAAYAAQPCLPCSQAMPCACTAANAADCGATFLVPGTAPPCQAQNFLTYTPKCNPCTSSVGSVQFQNLPPHQYYASQQQCLGLCNVSNSLTQVFTPTGGVAYWYKGPVVYAEISACVSCSAVPNLVCGATQCQAGHFLTNVSTCAACTVAACPLGSFREACAAGSIGDARCLPCAASSNVNYDVNHGLPLAHWLQLALNATTAWRWVVGTPSIAVAQQGGGGGGVCYAACANNYVMVDASTGGPPIANRTAACISCSSSFILYGLEQASSTPLYSVWNATPSNSPNAMVPPYMLPNSTLAQLAGLPGACYQCVSASFDTIAGDDVLCNALPGHGTNSGVSPSLTGMVVPSSVLLAGNTNTLAAAQPQTAAGKPLFCCKAGNVCAYYSLLEAQSLQALAQFTCVNVTTTTSGGGRRLLLQQPQGAAVNNYSATQTQTVTVFAQPLVGQNDAHAFECCTALPTGKTQCTVLSVQAYEWEKELLGSEFGDYCTATVAQQQQQRRRLLQQQTSATAPCFAGQFKATRGDGPCMNCPFGSSTGYPWNGLTSSDACMCLPGYHRVIPGGCTACGEGYYRSPAMNESAGCMPCPPNMATPPGLVASGYCYCSNGTYLTNNGSCLACERGYYCDGGVRAPCPAHSSSPPAAIGRGGCVCDTGYYGYLATPDQECFAAPPAMTCGPNANSTASGSCVCSQQGGWKSAYYTDPVTQMPKQICVPTCAPGQYLVLGGGCQPCPPNTYGSGALQMPSKPASQQCTPCPANFQTTTVDGGAASLADCVCMQTLNAADGSCGGCPANTYYSVDACEPCPTGMQSPPGSVGVLACTCPAGFRAVANAATAWTCLACPIGFYSQTVGSACTPCPPGTSTEAEGQSSVRSCVCPVAGDTLWNGKCVSL